MVYDIISDVEFESDARKLYRKLRPVRRHADQLQLHVNMKLSQIIRLVGTLRHFCHREANIQRLKVPLSFVNRSIN